MESWGVELFELAGLGESITMMECSAHDGMHAWEDHVLVECLNVADDEPVADGEIGELVVTVLTDPFLPMIRYRTDDLISINRKRCACGRTHARLKVVGRKGDQMLVAGRPILPNELQPIIEAERAARAGLFQIIKSDEQMDFLHLRIGHDPAALSGSPEALRGRLREAIEDRLAVRVEIDLVLDADLLKLGPPHKIPRVTSC